MVKMADSAMMRQDMPMTPREGSRHSVSAGAGWSGMVAMAFVGQ